MARNDTKEVNKASEVFTLPEGMLINSSFFVKDAFDDKSVPSYKGEIAIKKSDPLLLELEDRLLDFADAKWGKGAGDDPDLVLPLLDGDVLARKREKKNKEGDAYKGTTVIRFNTVYNKDGVDGPGGVQVYDEEVQPITPARSGEIYPGCYVEVAVVISGYEDNQGNNALKFYLSAVQKTRDGEKLVKAADRSSLFKPVGRSGGGEAAGEDRRRRRATR